jgi:N-methylhydantoinase A
MRVAIDTGGTFTDCVFVRRGRLVILKVFSTPGDPARAIAQALAELRAPPSEPLALLHGTTVGTNALLERRLARAALVTTAGFEDVLAIGRQARPELYNFFVRRPPPLVPAALRFGLAERIGPRGEVLKRLPAAGLARLRGWLRHARPEAVAVSLLFSFANSAHEKRVARAARALGVPVSVSHEILPEFREYERTSTVVANAALAPRMSRYLGRLEQVAGAADGGRSRVLVMQSNGGIVSAAAAAAQPVRTLLSGPAGGVVGAQAIARRAGCERVISFDMGGTSTDVALLARTGQASELATTKEAAVGGVPIAVPMLDIHTVGAGGGSLAWFDRGGALRVGPQSAGADPGPICYGRGREPTVTDAHLVLGRLDPDQFLGGRWRLEERRAREHMQKFLRRAPKASGLRSVEALAAGIVRVANAVMERALRVISVERGYDPREFVLVAFGGAGGLHACELAAALGLARVLIPKFPGGLSALGILCSDVAKDFSRTILAPAEARETRARLEREFRRLERQARAELRREGFAPRAQRLSRQLDLRYRGQAFELTVPFTREFAAAFHRAHERRYGYADPARPVEVVNVRLRAVGITEKPVFRPAALSRAMPAAARFKRAPVHFEGRRVLADFFIRERLRPGNFFAGPAVVAEYSATTVVPPGWRARVDAWGNLELERAR